MIITIITITITIISVVICIEFDSLQLMMSKMSGVRHIMVYFSIINSRSVRVTVYKDTVSKLIKHWVEQTVKCLCSIAKLLNTDKEKNYHAHIVILPKVNKLPQLFTHSKRGFADAIVPASTLASQQDSHSILTSGS